MRAHGSRKSAIGYLILAAAVAAGVGIVLMDRGAPPAASVAPGTSIRAAPHAAVLAFESEPAVIRFGGPAAEVYEVHGFEHARSTPSPERAVGIRRRSEIWLLWPLPAPRVAILDLEVP